MYTKTNILLINSILLFAAGIANCTDFQNNVKSAAKSLGGINCLTDSVFAVENVANDFIDDIQTCSEEESDVVAELVEYCETIARKTENVIDSDNNICRNSAYNEATDANKSPPALCASAITTRMDKLNAIVDKTETYVTNNVDKITDSCSQMAATELKLNLPMFTESVGNCAKLFKK